MHVSVNDKRTEIHESLCNLIRDYLFRTNVVSKQMILVMQHEKPIRHTFLFPNTFWKAVHINIREEQFPSPCTFSTSFFSLSLFILHIVS